MQHIFTHQQQYPGEWSQGHHQHPNHHVAQQQGQLQAQAQAAAAAAAVAQQQQQHYNRITANNGAAMVGGGIIPRGPANDIQSGSEVGMSEENKRVLEWIAQLMKTNTREAALLELSKKREQVPELALILWHSFGNVPFRAEPKLGLTDSGVMASLLQEIISVYPLLNPSQLTAAASNRVCNALALLQCVASHTETRGLFLSGSSSTHSHFINFANKSSTYSPVPLSFSQHHFEVAPI